MPRSAPEPSQQGRGSGASQASVRAARRAVPPRAQIALLPHARFAARSRGRRAGDLFARLAQLRRFEGRGIVSRLALSDRHQRVPRCASARKQCAAPSARPARSAQRSEMPDGTPAADVPWLEPYPDSDLEGIADEPLIRRRATRPARPMQLAFVAAIQQLPPRQRAALLLCDVLGWSAAEAATLLGGSTASVNSALQRSRETLAKRYPDGRPAATSSRTGRSKNCSTVICRPGRGSISDGFASLLKEDATYTMPPLPQWYAGREAIRRLLWVGLEVVWRVSPVCRRRPTGSPPSPSMSAPGRTSLVVVHRGAGARG